MPVLALHGWLDNAASFDRLAPLLVEAHPEIDLVALDLPGHGQSDHRPAGINQYFIDYVPVVMQVVRALGWDRFALLGHSLGAGIATLVAGTFPERILFVLLVDGFGPMSDRPEQAPGRLRDAIEEIWKEEGRPARPGRAYSSIGQAVGARRRTGKLSEESARLLVERGMRRSVKGYVWRSDARLKTPSATRLTEEQVRAFLSAIQCPVCVVFADDSEFVQLAELVRPRLKLLPQLESHTLSGGHHLHMENPGGVAGVFSEFISRGSGDP